MKEKILPTVNRPEAELRERLPIGTPEQLIAQLRAFAAAGLQQAYVWPVADEIHQLELIHEHVLPYL